MSRYLINEPVKAFQPTLAIIFGLNEAILLQEIHYAVSRETNKNIHNGLRWVYNSYAQWKEIFPFWHQDTIKRAITSLEKKGALISDRFNQRKFDKTKWYTIDYKKLLEIETKYLLNSGFNPSDYPNVVKQGQEPSKSRSVQNAPTISAKCTDDQCKMHRPIPDHDLQIMNTDIRNKIKNDRDSQNSRDHSLVIYKNKFEEQWKRYSKLQRRGSKKRAANTWNKLKPEVHDLIDKALDALEARNAFWLSKGGDAYGTIEFLPHFSTWLNDEGWNCDYSNETIRVSRVAPVNGKKTNQSDYGPVRNDVLPPPKDKEIMDEMSRIYINPNFNVETKRSTLESLANRLESKNNQKQAREVIASMK